MNTAKAVKVKRMKQDGVQLCGRCKEPIWKSESYTESDMGPMDAPYRRLVHLAPCKPKP